MDLDACPFTGQDAIIRSGIFMHVCVHPPMILSSRRGRAATQPQHRVAHAERRKPWSATAKNGGRGRHATPPRARARGRRAGFCEEEIAVPKKKNWDGSRRGVRVPVEDGELVVDRDRGIPGVRSQAGRHATRGCAHVDCGEEMGLIRAIFLFFSFFNENKRTPHLLTDSGCVLSYVFSTLPHSFFTRFFRLLNGTNSIPKYKNLGQVKTFLSITYLDGLSVQILCT